MKRRPVLGASSVRCAVSGPGLFLVVALAYACGSGVSFLLLHASSAGAVFFPPAGVTLAALVLTPTRLWPWVLAAAGITELAVDLSQGQHFSAAAGFALANTVEPLVGATLLRRLVSELDLTRRRDLAGFVGFAVLAGPAVGALIGASTIQLALQGSFETSYAPFWAGDGLGVLTVAGAALSWRSRAARTGVRALSVWWSGVVLTAVVTTGGFWPRSVPLAYLSLPLLYWAAFSGGVTAVATAGLAMTLSANVVTAVGRGPWAALADTPHTEIATLQLFLAVAVLGAWLLAVEVSEREQARSTSRREEAARRRVQALQQVTAQLATAATSEDIAQVITRQGISLVSEAGVVGLLSRDGQQLRTWTTSGFPAELAAPFVQLHVNDDTAITRAVQTNQAVIVRSLADVAAQFPATLPTYLGTGTVSGLTLPASIGDRTVGALAFGFPTEDAVDADVLDFAQALAQLTAQAVERARLYERVRDEAHELQQALLPVPLTHLDGMSAAVCYRPADQQHDVGGDWYDVFPLDGGRIGFVVGDVVGHDLRAAAAMGRLQAVLRVLADTAPGPAQVLDRLDEAVTGIAGALVSTVGYGDYDPASGFLRYACAGHLPPLLVTGRQSNYLQEGRSEPLGVSTGPRPEGIAQIPAGSLLLWCTDGLVERRTEDIDVGLTRLAELAPRLSHLDLDTLCTTTVEQMAAGQLLQDDVALLCLRLDRTTTITATHQSPAQPESSRHLASPPLSRAP